MMPLQIPHCRTSTPLFGVRLWPFMPGLIGMRIPGSCSNCRSSLSGAGYFYVAGTHKFLAELMSN
jgi:hypothetical protein